MKEKHIVVILTVVILLEVFFILQNPAIFSEHYLILFILPAAAFAYFLVITSQKKLNLLAKSNPVITPEQHQNYILTEGKRLANQLLASKKFEQFKAVKLGEAQQDPIPPSKQKQQEEILKELEEMESAIFDD